MNLFGRKKQAAPTATPVETINTLRQNLTVLEKREEHINKKIDACLAEARAKSQKKDKNGALFALKRKKMYEGEVAKLQGARITLDAQILALESAAVNIETFKAMKSGAGAMKQMRGNIDADKVDDIMDEIEEEKDIHNAISEAISRPGQDLFNDEELLEELAELDALDAEETLLNNTSETIQQPPNTIFNLPLAPTTKLSPKETSSNVESEEERALRELEASMLG